MKIINPLYDTAFKYLMQNERLAKKALSVMLGQEIIELSLGQQETIFPDEKRGLSLFRLDFKPALILLRYRETKFSTSGKQKLVLAYKSRKSLIKSSDWDASCS